jgi:hypothetical protein
MLQFEIRNLRSSPSARRIAGLPPVFLPPIRVSPDVSAS